MGSPVPERNGTGGARRKGRATITSGEPYLDLSIANELSAPVVLGAVEKRPGNG